MYLSSDPQRTFYSLYKYGPPSSPDDTSRLSVLLTDLIPEQEKKLDLRKYLLHKHDAGLMNIKGSLGILSAEISKIKVTPPPSIYYTVLTNDDEKNQVDYVLCLIDTVANNGLNVFLSDLHKFTLNVKEILYDKAITDVERDTALRKCLPSWYSISVEYLTRAISLVGEELPVLLHAALIGKHVLVKPHRNSEDITRLVEAVRLTDTNDDMLEEDDNVIVSLANANPDLVIQDDPSSQQIINSTETNDFCISWAKELLSSQQSEELWNPLQIRQDIDNKKLQVLNERNSLNQRINEAKYDHYALYKAYMELKENPNQDVLLVLLLRDSNSDKETKEVIEVIYTFNKEKLQPVVV